MSKPKSSAYKRKSDCKPVKKKTATSTQRVLWVDCMFQCRNLFALLKTFLVKPLELSEQKNATHRQRFVGTLVKTKKGYVHCLHGFSSFTAALSCLLLNSFSVVIFIKCKLPTKTNLISIVKVKKSDCNSGKIKNSCFYWILEFLVLQIL